MTDNRDKPSTGGNNAQARGELRDRTYFRWRRQREAKEQAKVARLRALRLKRDAAERATEPSVAAASQRKQKKRLPAAGHGRAVRG